MNICMAFGGIIFIARRIDANEWHVFYKAEIFERLKARHWTHDKGLKLKIWETLNDQRDQSYIVTKVI